MLFAKAWFVIGSIKIGRLYCTYVWGPSGDIQDVMSIVSVYWDHPMSDAWKCHFMCPRTIDIFLRIRAAVQSSFAWWCPLEELPAERGRNIDPFQAKKSLVGWL